MYRQRCVTILLYVHLYINNFTPRSDNNLSNNHNFTFLFSLCTVTLGRAFVAGNVLVAGAAVASLQVGEH